MKRLVKVLLVLVVLLLLLLGGAFFGVHWYVQSAEGTARIQSELSKALGLPLEIRQAALGFGGVRLFDVRIVAEGQTYLEAPSFSTEYQFAPLLRRQVVLRKMVLESPKIAWPQTEDGHWVLPTRAHAPKSTTASAPKAPSAEKEFELALDTLEIKNGTIDMLDHQGGRLAHLERVQIKVSLATAGTVSGGVTAKSLALLQGGPVLENVDLPFQYAEGKLTCPKGEAELGGGNVHASLTLEPKASNPPFDLHLDLEKVELAHVVQDPAWQIRSGQLSAALSLHGTSRDFQRGTGHGELHLTQAQLASLEPLLRLIGQSCHIPELANLKLSLQSNVSTFAQTLGIPEIVSLREASAVFQMNKKETVIESLIVDGGDLAVTTKGTISQEGKLKLDASLLFSDALVKRLPSFVKESLSPPGPDARRVIAFNITGTNDRPKTNLVDKVLGPKIGSQFSSIVESIFTPRKKDKDQDPDKSDGEKKEKKKKDKDKDKNKEKEMGAEKPAGAAPAAPAEISPQSATPAEPTAPSAPLPRTPAEPVVGN